MQFVVLALVAMLMWRQGVVDSVRIVELRVAAHMTEGSTGLLGCNFDLGDEALYSLKWYKDGREFFRYVPKAQPTMKSFYAPGVMVDLNRSSVNVVALKRLSRESGGEYQCEVKAEAPTFTRVAQHKRVVVDLLPEWGPHIIGLHDEYHVGSQVTLNCTTAPSRPESHLKWLINGQEAPENCVYGPFLMPTNRPFTYQAKLLLNFTVEAGHFDETGAMTLKCQATIPPLYHQEKEFTFYEPVLQATTKLISTDNVAPTDIPKILLILQVLIMFLVNLV